MEITDASGEDSILRNIEETRKLWTEQGEAKKDTKMLQPSTKNYKNVALEDISTSSDSESESEIAIPSVRNLKSAWDKKPKESVPLRVQPIHVPIIKKKEAPQMRQRMHREPVDQNNVIRPSQAGVPERPDYVVNLKAMQNQFMNGNAPKASRPITEPLPNKKTIIPRVKSAPIPTNTEEIVRSVAGEREVAITGEGGLKAIRSRWETHAEEVSTRGRARSRRPDPIDLKAEAKNVRFREKSQKRESRTARRAASAGRLNDSSGMSVYNRRSQSKSPPRSNQSDRRKQEKAKNAKNPEETKPKSPQEAPKMPDRVKAPSPKPQVKKPEAKSPEPTKITNLPLSEPEKPVSKPVTSAKTPEPVKVTDPLPVLDLPVKQEQDVKKSTNIEIAPKVESEPVSMISETKPDQDDFDLLAQPVQESPVEVKTDFDLLNGDQFNDSKSVTELKKEITGDLEESLSTKSSSIDLVSPVVSDVGNLKAEDSLATNSEAESVREANMLMFDLVKETSSENEKTSSPAASPIIPQADSLFSLDTETQVISSKTSAAPSIPSRPASTTPSLPPRLPSRDKSPLDRSSSFDPATPLVSAELEDSSHQFDLLGDFSASAAAKPAVPVTSNLDLFNI